MSQIQTDIKKKNNKQTAVYKAQQRKLNKNSIKILV